jgi:vacuolar fusion protein MON1
MIRWRSRRKHFFVLSSAGKPIYSRYGDDNIISGYMGVIQTIISFFEDNGDTLKYLPATHKSAVDMLGVSPREHIALQSSKKVPYTSSQSPRAENQNPRFPSISPF